MPRLKLTKEEFNVKELDVEIDREQSFQRYDGDIPRNGTILIARVTKMWWTSSQEGDSQIRLIVVAEQNEDRKAEYNDLPTWERLTFKKSAAFRYLPFLENFDISLADVFNKTIVSDGEDKIGIPIESIAGWEPGSDEALCRIVIERDHFGKDVQSKVAVDGWLPYEDADTEADDEEDEEPPARSRRQPAVKATKARTRRAPEPEPDDEDDEDDEDQDVDEDDLDDDEDDEDDVEDEAPPARSRRAPARTAAPARTRAGANGGRAARSETARGTATKTRTSTRTSARAAGSDDDPPF
jgi:hypothetical protein